MCSICSRVRSSVLCLLFVSVLTSGLAGGQPPEWTVKVDFNHQLKVMDGMYLSANVNAPTKMAQYDARFDSAVRSLGIKMMRFQVPGKKSDYRTIAAWTEKEFAGLDNAVKKAREKWGVEELMFGIHRASLPVGKDGRFVHAEFAAYADTCAALVKRYAPVGNVRVRYWEPFNELDHHKALKRMATKGRGLRELAQLYAACAKAMKAVNPEIKVGGPSLCDANAGVLKVFLEEAGQYMDFVSWHDYPTGNSQTSDDVMLQAVVGPKRFVGGAANLRAVMKSKGFENLPLLLGEYHVNWSAWAPVEPRTATQFSAVFVGSVIANMSRTSTGRIMIHDVLSRYYGLLGLASSDIVARRTECIDDKVEPTGGIHVRPSGWVYRWFNELAGGQWVACETAIPAADAKTPRGPLLEAVAWQNESSRVVMLVNKGRATRDVSVDFGAIVASDGFDTPVRVMTVANTRPMDIRTTGTRAGQFKWALPPMSVTFIVTRPNSEEVQAE